MGTAQMLSALGAAAVMIFVLYSTTAPYSGRRGSELLWEMERDGVTPQRTFQALRELHSGATILGFAYGALWMGLLLAAIGLFC